MGNENNIYANEIDSEWMELIKVAYDMGIFIEAIKKFLANSKNCN